MARAKGPLAATLAAHNVIPHYWEDGTFYGLTCGHCGKSFPVMSSRGRLVPRYWQCPNGCNAATEEAPETATEAAPAVFADLASLPAILTPAEAAGLLRVSETTAKDWARRGDLPGAFKLGKEWRIERDALLAYIGRASDTGRLRAALNMVLAETGKDFLSAAETLQAVNRMRAITQAALTGGDFSKL